VSKMPRLARVLTELSLILIELDKTIYLFERQRGSKSQFSDKKYGRIEILISYIHLVFKKASTIYEIQWNRGI
jgi:hypothetical protein